MIASVEGSSSPVIDSGARLFQRLAEASDMCAFLAALQEALPLLMPETRVDIMVGTQLSEYRVMLTCNGEGDLLPPEQCASITHLIDWLVGQGYLRTSTFPLIAISQHHGWLVLGQRHLPLDPALVEFAGQLAALLALRLTYEQKCAESAAQCEQMASVDRRMREVDQVRQQAILAAGAVHDIGNLLAAVMGHVQLLMLVAPQSMQTDLHTILRAARDGHHLMHRILTDKEQPVPATIGMPISLLPVIVRDAIKIMQPSLEARPDITLKTALFSVPAVSGHAVELREVMVNLIKNAIAAMPQGGTLTVRSYTLDERVVVEVADTGEGISQARQSTIFEPFVTTREAGSGLGLSVSRAIIESHGGTLTVDSALNQGATFTLTLPALRKLDPLHKAQPHQVVS